MKLPNKSAGTFELPLIGLGTWGIGGFYERDYENNDIDDITAIQTAIDLGVTHIDTAELYAEGYSETLVGIAIKDFDRADLQITSKVHPENGSQQAIYDACRASLERLGLEYLDLYLMHSPNQFIPIEETMAGFARLVEEKLVKNIGVSNFSHTELSSAQKASNYPLVNNQIHYSLGARGWVEDGTIDYCERNSVLVTAYRPLRGKILNQPLLVEIAKKYNKTPAQIAINWVINKPNIVTLVKSSQKQHLQENLEAIGWRLEKEDEDKLDKEFPRGEMAHGPRK
jgi:diketogulonate reductase-like aldo/keto reductase